MGKSIAVLGMGRFGTSLATSLYEMGSDVMAVDKSKEVLEDISDRVTYAIQADLSKPEAIKGLGLEGVDIVVVAIGSDLTSSIMSVMVSKEIGVPYVIAKVSDERMGDILEKVGADKVIFPEKEGGVRTARILQSESFIEFFDIGSNLCLLEIKPKKEWIGKTLIELKLREKYKMNVVAIRDQDKMKSVVDPNKPLLEENALLVIIDKKDAGRL